MEKEEKSIWNGPPVWYFAYGSNMKSESMTKRAISPLDVKAVQLPGYYFNFDVFGTPFSEPCYASIEAFPNAEGSSLQLEWKSKQLAVPAVCGIAYLLSPEDFHRLLSSEGGGIVYDVIEVAANVLGQSVPGCGRKTLFVYTLKAKHPQRPNGTPSLRYMTLFREGAETMRLPKSYLDYLRALPDYSKPRAGEEPSGMWIFAYLWRPFIKTVTRLHTYRVDADGNCPRWVAILIVALYQIMWAYHDSVHQRIFSSGDGGKLRYVTKALK